MYKGPQVNQSRNSLTMKGHHRKNCGITLESQKDTENVTGIYSSKEYLSGPGNINHHHTGTTTHNYLIVQGTANGNIVVLGHGSQDHCLTCRKNSHEKNPKGQTQNCNGIVN